MPRKSSSNHLAPRLFLAAILLAAAALTGCSAASSSGSATQPCLFGAAHAAPEPISTLGQNYTLPPDPRHRTRLREVPIGELASNPRRTL